MFTSSPISRALFFTQWLLIGAAGCIGFPFFALFTMASWDDPAAAKLIAPVLISMGLVYLGCLAATVASGLLFKSKSALEPDAIKASHVLVGVSLIGVIGFLVLTAFYWVPYVFLFKIMMAFWAMWAPLTIHVKIQQNISKVPPSQLSMKDAPADTPMAPGRGPAQIIALLLAAWCALGLPWLTVILISAFLDYDTHVLKAFYLVCDMGASVLLITLALRFFFSGSQSLAKTAVWQIPAASMLVLFAVVFRWLFAMNDANEYADVFHFVSPLKAVLGEMFMILFASHIVYAWVKARKHLSSRLAITDPAPPSNSSGQ